MENVVSLDITQDELRLVEPNGTGSYMVFCIQQVLHEDNFHFENQVYVIDKVYWFLGIKQRVITQNDEVIVGHGYNMRIFP